MIKEVMRTKRLIESANTLKENDNLGNSKLQSVFNQIPNIPDAKYLLVEYTAWGQLQSVELKTINKAYIEQDMIRELGSDEPNEFYFCLYNPETNSGMWSTQEERALSFISYQNFPNEISQILEAKGNKPNSIRDLMDKCWDLIAALETKAGIEDLSL